MVKRIIIRILLFLGAVIAVLAINLLIVNIISSRISEGTPLEDPNPENVALLVIDIQGGTTGDVSALKEIKAQSEPFISRVNSVIEDYTSRDQLVVYIRTEIVNPLLNVLNNTMAKGTDGSELDPRLRTGAGPEVVKRRSDSFMDTDLDQILTEHRIGKVVLVGLDASQCVKSTVQAALNRGYSVAVVDQGVISKTEAIRTEAIKEFRQMGVEIMSLD
jgi:nicotinamidase-related amidase